MKLRKGVKEVGGCQIERFEPNPMTSDERTFNLAVIGLCDEINALLLTPDRPSLNAALRRLGFIVELAAIPHFASIRLILAVVQVRISVAEEALRCDADDRLLAYADRVCDLVSSKIRAAF